MYSEVWSAVSHGREHKVRVKEWVGDCLESDCAGVGELMGGVSC